MAVSDLRKLLAGMKPALSGEKYYFASIDEGHLMALAGYLGSIAGIFREEEGLTIVFSQGIWEGMSQFTEKEISGPFALITLTIESDLMAVGFLAAMAGALAKEGISVNAFSAYHHDHLFVPYEKRDSAMAALARLSKS